MDLSNREKNIVKGSSLLGACKVLCNMKKLAWCDKCKGNFQNLYCDHVIIEAAEYIK